MGMSYDSEKEAFLHLALFIIVVLAIVIELKILYKFWRNLQQFLRWVFHDENNNVVLPQVDHPQFWVIARQRGFVNLNPSEENAEEENNLMNQEFPNEEQNHLQQDEFDDEEDFLLYDDDGDSEMEEDDSETKDKKLS